MSLIQICCLVAITLSESEAEAFTAPAAAMKPWLSANIVRTVVIMAVM